MGAAQQIPTYIALVGMSGAFAVGGTLLKLHVASGNVLVLMAALSAYMLGNGFLILLLRTEPLAAAMALSGSAQILAMAAVGYWLGDRLTGPQWIGIALCIAAMWLLLAAPGEAPAARNGSLDSTRAKETAPKL